MKVNLQGVRRVSITGEYIKLDALLKYASIASTGGEAKAIIQNGEVFVGGEPCMQRGKKIRPGDVVRYGKDALVIGALKSSPRSQPNECDINPSNGGGK